MTRYSTSWLKSDFSSDSESFSNNALQKLQVSD